MLNIVEPAQIEEAAERGRKTIFICDNCGFCEMDTEHSQDYLRDTPLEDWQGRLPIGSISDGTFVDYQGEHLSRHDFIVKYGVDPKRYLKWKKAGMPEPTNKC